MSAKKKYRPKLMWMAEQEDGPWLKVGELVDLAWTPEHVTCRVLLADDRAEDGIAGAVESRVRRWFRVGSTEYVEFGALVSSIGPGTDDGDSIRLDLWR